MSMSFFTTVRGTGALRALAWRDLGAAQTALAEPAQDIEGELNATDVKVTTADGAWIDLASEEIPFCTTEKPVGCSGTGIL